LAKTFSSEEWNDNYLEVGFQILKPVKLHKLSVNKRGMTKLTLSKYATVAFERRNVPALSWEFFQATREKQILFLSFGRERQGTS